ncbi:MAG: HAMP domain-containing protein [Acidobacteria bacterium]|nr:MAG: HAMP domain-containing protein [Acidobacteriota bacterium]
MSRGGESGGSKPRARRRTVYLAVFAALVLAAVGAHLAAPGGDLAGLTTFLASLWALPAVFVGLRRLWRALTYRVGVRLFISYLLIGLTPFALAACLAFVVGYALVGQYAATRVRGEMDKLGSTLAGLARAAAVELAAGRPAAAQQTVEQGGQALANAMRLEWVLDAPSGRSSSPGAAALPVPGWATEAGWQGAVFAGRSGYLAAVARRGDAVAAVLLPLDLATARAFGPGRWYEVRFVTQERPSGPKGNSVTIAGAPDGAAAVTVNGRPAAAAEIEPEWLSGKSNPGATWWQRVRLFWAWPTTDPRAFESGAELKDAIVLTVIKLAPRDALAELFAPQEGVGREFKRMLRIVGIVFGALYLVAVGFAAVMILRIATAAGRLTRGARAVAAGDLAHRIPVKRRDQLGDLAVSFNAMTESVHGMLSDVAEKERLAGEMELAREIQESLLPPSELTSGALAVVAHFRPAAEVGGDYFDVLELAPGRIVAAIGDVAGHGLPTGLLMAMVKSAVAALAGEGRRGRDLLERLNRLLLGQSLRQRMVSLALAEIDAAAGRLEITSAGHPPGVLLASDGTTEEILLGSLPLGHPWPDSPPSRTLAFPPGSRLLLYSDGLVEGRNAGGEPFGYDALHAVLAEHRDASPRALVAAVLGALDRHLGGAPLTDDLTIVLVEHTKTAGAG